MNDPIPFGTPVRLAAVVEPRYLTWQTERTTYDHDGSGGFSWGRTEPVDPPQLVDPSEVSKGPIGGPLPGSPEIPYRDQRIHRRLRRFDTDRTGVVVGSVLRKEGLYTPGSGGGFDPYTGEYDREPAFLSPAHTVRLVQVACEPAGPRGPARIVLAHPDDVETEDDR